MVYLNQVEIRREAVERLARDGNRERGNCPPRIWLLQRGRRPRSGQHRRRGVVENVAGDPARAIHTTNISNSNNNPILLSR